MNKTDFGLCCCNAYVANRPPPQRRIPRHLRIVCRDPRRHLILFTLEEINSVESEVTKIDHAKHTGHLAAAQVREQYIHQVHVLVNRNLQRLEHYEQVAALTRERTKQLQQLPLASEEKTLADQVMRLAEANDQTFREEVIPALERSLDPRTHGLSERLEAHVDKVVHLNEALNLKLEQRSLALIQHAQQLRTNARVVVLACFTLAIMVSLVLGLLLIRSILRPLGVLRAGVLKIAEGDLGTRIHLEGRDEFAELAACFNRMARDLVRRQEDRVRSQKLAAIGQIAAGLAHKINNPPRGHLGLRQAHAHGPRPGQSQRIADRRGRGAAMPEDRARSAGTGAARSVAPRTGGPGGDRPRDRGAF